MISLYQFLLNNNYTQAETDETIIRYYNGFTLPTDVKTDIKRYWEEQTKGSRAEPQGSKSEKQPF